MKDPPGRVRRRSFQWSTLQRSSLYETIYLCTTTAAWSRDHFLLFADCAAFIECQERVDSLCRAPEEWVRRAILNVAGRGRLSSDRRILEYGEQVWKVRPATQA